MGWGGSRPESIVNKSHVDLLVTIPVQSLALLLIQPKMMKNRINILKGSMNVVFVSSLLMVLPFHFFSITSPIPLD